MRANIEEILKSLDGIQPARPKPFFTGRVLQRLRSEELEGQSLMTPRFRMAVVAVFLLIAFNMILLFFQFRTELPALSEWKRTTPNWVVEYNENPASLLKEPLNK